MCEFCLIDTAMRTSEFSSTGGDVSEEHMDAANSIIIEDRRAKHTVKIMS